MEPWLIILLVCGAYLAITLVMGVWSSRTVSDSVAGYVAGDRAMNVVVLYFVLGASVFSSFAFLGAPGWAYSRGMAALYIIAYGIVGMVPLYFFGPRARRLGERYGFVTQAELLMHRYDSRTLSVLLAVLSVAAFVPYMTLQMKGAGYILATISDGRVPEWLGALVTYGVVVVYVFTSGVMGIGWTNTFQGLFMLAIAWFLGLYLPATLYGGVGAMFNEIAVSDFRAMLQAPGLGADGEPWSWGEYSSAVLVSAVGFSMWPHLFMKSYAARSERTLRLTVVLYPTFQLFLVPILLIGFAGVLAYPNVSPADTIVPYLLTQIELSPLIVGLVCAGTLAASMSSGDAILHAAALTPPATLDPRARRRDQRRGLLLCRRFGGVDRGATPRRLRRRRADLPAHLCRLLLAAGHRCRSRGRSRRRHRRQHALPRSPRAQTLPAARGDVRPRGEPDDLCPRELEHSPRTREEAARLRRVRRPGRGVRRGERRRRGDGRATMPAHPFEYVLGGRRARTPLRGVAIPSAQVVAPRARTPLPQRC